MEDTEKTELSRLAGLFAGLIRIGIVMAVDNEKRLARVIFNDPAFNSDWLPVLINRDVIRDFTPDYAALYRPEYERRGGTRPLYIRREHNIIKPWMPKINEQVLCIYCPSRDMKKADGYILGGIQPWR